MSTEIQRKIEGFIDDSLGLNDEWSASRWSMKVASFLKTCFSDAKEADFVGLGCDNRFDQMAMQQGFLEGIVARLADSASQDEGATPHSCAPQLPAPTTAGSGTRKIFVVHGHDSAAKEATARFLTNLDLAPIILHEQSNGGRTIIEKFEMYSKDVGFAIVLLTPDDRGAAQDEAEELKPRARQNVILELGYFLGKLSRTHVCALYKGDVELPTDIQGVIYIEMDDAGGWRTQLAQELVQAKCPINLAGLLPS